MNEINRSQLISLSNAAYQLENYALSRKILLTWLRKYPNDLWIRYRLAIVLYKLGMAQEAIRLSESIVSLDPEFCEVWSLLSVLYPEISKERKIALMRVKTLKNASQTRQNQTKKKILLFGGSNGKAFEEVDQQDDFDLLKAIQTSRRMIEEDDLASAYRLLKIFSRRWPKVLQFQLILGDVLNRMGKVEDGIKLIHATVERDLLGQVAMRIWHGENPYCRLWLDPESLSSEISDLLIPADVANKAEMDELISDSIASQTVQEPEKESVSDGTTSDQTDVVPVITRTDEGSVVISLRDEESQNEEHSYSLESVHVDPQVENPAPNVANAAIQNETKAELSSGFASIGGRLLTGFFTDRRNTKNSDGDNIPIRGYIYKLNANDADERYPVYVVMSTVAGLTNKYGKNNKDFIDQEMRSVADAVENRSGWNGLVYYPDEFSSGGLMSAESIRSGLVQLDQQLTDKGSMIGALLIIGGHDVVPFFSLNNPTSDDDVQILSDAPYSTTVAGRYYEQLWQVGRIPGDSSNDPGLLLSQLREIQNYHLGKGSSKDVEMAQKKRKGVFKQPLLRKNKNQWDVFGYSCAAWQKPSEAVFQTIGNVSDLLLCPQTTSANVPNVALESNDYAYFNMHGIKGKPNWYGQKAAGDNSAGPMLPVALEIENLKQLVKTPKIVFSECCYGAESDNRNEMDAISLHMVGRDTHVFIGSTAIAYGAMHLPLTAADLLAYLFWKHLNEGVVAGEAFRRAKKNLAVEIEAANGGLDSEIQKTLISFVFYGDPLYAVDNSADITDRMQRAKTPREYELFTEATSQDISIDSDMAKRIFDNVKTKYNIASVNDDFSNFSIKKQIYHNLTGRYTAHKANQMENYIITYVKDRKVAGVVERQIVRVTVCENGEIKKVSFSR